MFSTQVFLLCLILVGLIAAKARLVDEKSRISLTDLVLNVFLPCTILVSFFGTSRSELPSLGIMVIISIGTLFISFFLAKILFIKAKPEQKKVLLYAMLIPNASFIGFPLIESIFGTASLSYAAAYLIPLRAVLWSVGLSIFAGGKEKILKIIFHPCMAATYLGLIVMFFDFKPPELAIRLIESLGNCTTPLSMMVVGCVLGQTRVKNLLNPLVFYFSFVRLILVPLIIMGILLIFRPMYLIAGVSVIMAGTPAGVTTAILADKYGADSELASKMVFISTLLSLLTVPALVWLL